MQKGYWMHLLEVSSASSLFCNNSQPSNYAGASNNLSALRISLVFHQCFAITRNRRIMQAHPITLLLSESHLCFTNACNSLQLSNYAGASNLLCRHYAYDPDRVHRSVFRCSYRFCCNCVYNVKSLNGFAKDGVLAVEV